jgi:hypothetical protein
MISMSCRSSRAALQCAPAAIAKRQSSGGATLRGVERAAVFNRLRAAVGLRREPALAILPYAGPTIALALAPARDAD